MIRNNTLQDLFLRLRGCSGHGITFINSSNEDSYVSYEMLNKRAGFILGTLQGHGIKAGDELVFQLSQPQYFIETFWALYRSRLHLRLPKS